MYPKGTRIEKCNTKPGEDGHPDGVQGAVVAVMYNLTDNPLQHEGHTCHGVYMIEWDDLPGIPVAVVDYRVKKIESNGT